MGEIRLDKMSGACPGFYPVLFLESGMKKQQNDFLNGSILPSLLRFAGPVLLALFLQAMYGAVDLIVVGKFAGTADISAVSTGSQAMQLVTSLLVGLTTGVTVLLGQKIGEGKPDEAGSVIGSAICLFVCVALGCESIVEPQEEGGESEGGEDVEEQTGTGTDVRSRLDVRFGLQPVEKDLNRLPQGTDAGGYGIFGNKNIVLFPLSRRDERDVPLGLQMGSPFCVDIGTICIEPAVCDRCAVQIDLLCSPQVAETGFADLYGAGNGKLMRAQLGKNMQLDAVVPQVFRGISR